MTAANIISAVASSRAKYACDFRVPTLLGAQPRFHNLLLAADAQNFSESLRDFTQLFQRRGLQLQHRARTQNPLNPPVVQRLL
jgi:hypothetical protein